ncbi:MAG: adenylate/guanylate cyclase domain-containing protein [Flavisolibacter sp.]|nr:adenylate/guanylate cyclase domain-containing protein [Flavisolibacter sp.]
MLFLNILPADTADELKATGTAKAKYYQSVSVLFADFKGFTQMSERLPPAMLVSELNEVFTAFDRIIQKYEIEKIKTIGDAYMCAGGLPVPNNTHPKDVVNAALEMRDYIHQCNENRQDDIVFEVRLGISTGPVISGIVGLKKFAYDIWGDTVNIAARMETCSEPGRINISGATYELIKDDFYCTYRGKINAKNKGEVDMYFVENIKQTNASYTSSEISVV